MVKLASISGFFNQYRLLSNFWPAVVTGIGYEFPTVENAYQFISYNELKQQLLDTGFKKLIEENY